MKSVIEHILRLQDYVTGIQGLNITAPEFAYLKALVLFAPGELNKGYQIINSSGSIDKMTGFAEYNLVTIYFKSLN